MVVPRHRRARRWRTRWRRGRYHPRNTYPWRRHWYRRWHRRNQWRRRPYEVLKEVRPKGQTSLVVTGWEILGSVGSIITWTETGGIIKQLIKANNEVTYLYEMGITKENKDDKDEKTNTAEYKHFCGGYGGAWFTLGGLALRARYGMARFSKPLTGFTWIKFLGARVYLRQGWDVSYLFRWNTHHGGEKEHQAEKKWVHPGTMLNTPGHVTVLAHNHTFCCKAKKLKIKRPPAFSGWFDIDAFYSTLLGGYFWTAFDPWNPLGFRPINKSGSDVSIQHQQNCKYGNKSNCNDYSYFNFWWKDRTANQHGNQQPLWTNRKCFDKKFVDHAESGDGWNWWKMLWGQGDTTYFNGDQKPAFSPFAPPVYQASKQNTLWFQYKFFFKVGGRTLEANVPNFPIQEVYDPPSKGCQAGCKTCLQPGDLDKDGFIRRKKFKQLTESPLRKKLVKQLQKVLSRKIRKRIKRKVHWGCNSVYRY
ncbi:MAG: ORF1 protein [Upsilontorquevirus procy2]|uniref:ORF1 protein n=1 Tax=Anelloviridae sp. TaxID=2055263 RepID=A0A3G2YTE3_9VIRU|nr:MAG: ORF1 protein [Anelloviridae sp.]AYP28954.1 MAG: ORF1 protein [Anelloviridae sp.]